MNAFGQTTLFQLLLGLFLLLAQTNSGCPMGMDCAGTSMSCCETTQSGPQTSMVCMALCQVLPGAVAGLSTPMLLEQSIKTANAVAQLNSWTDPPGLRPPRVFLM